MHNSTNEHSPGDDNSIGDADIDIIEMELYDLYRGEYGEPHTLEYLKKCNIKLREQVKENRVVINKLQRLNMKLGVEKKMRLKV